MKLTFWILFLSLLLPITAHADSDAGQDVYDSLSYDEDEDTYRTPHQHTTKSPLWFRILFPIGTICVAAAVCNALGKPNV